MKTFAQVINGNFPAHCLTRSPSFKAMNRLTDKWLRWICTLWHSEGQPEIDLTNPEILIDKKEWKRAQKIFREEGPSPIPLGFDWDDEESVQELVKECYKMIKEENDLENKNWERLCKREEEKRMKEEEKIKKEEEEAKGRKMTYAEVARGPPVMVEISRSYNGMQILGVVVLLTYLNLVRPAQSAVIPEPWMNGTDTMFRICNGMVQRRLIGDENMGYTDRMWDRCCKEAQKEEDEIQGVCEVFNSEFGEDKAKHLFDLSWNGETIVRGRHCIELIRYCKEKWQEGELRTGTGWRPNTTAKAKVAPKAEAEEKGTSGVIGIEHDGCGKNPSDSHEMKTLLGKEVCIAICKGKGKSPSITLDQKYHGWFKRPECWDETYEEWKSEEREQALSKIKESQNLVKGGRRILDCFFEKCKEDGKTDVKFDLWLEPSEPVSIKLCEECKSYMLPKECLVSFRSSYVEVIIDMKAAAGEYYFRYGKDHKDGYFVDTKSVTIDITEPGSMNIMGYCNDRIIDRKIMVTTEEYCNEKYGSVLEKFEQVYCKQHRLIKTMVMTITILAILYWGHEMIGWVFGGIVALVFMFFTVVIAKRIICKTCSKLTAFGAGHICRPEECIYCGDKIFLESFAVSSTEAQMKDMILAHQKDRCKKFVTSNLFVICLVNYFRLFTRFFTCLFKRAPAIMLCLLLIWLSSLLFQEAGAETLNDIIRANVKKEIDEYVKSEVAKEVTKTEKIKSCYYQFMLYLLSLPTILLVVYFTRGMIAWIVFRVGIYMRKEPCLFCYKLLDTKEGSLGHKCKKLHCQTCNSVWGTSAIYDSDERIRTVVSEHDCFRGDKRSKCRMVYREKVKNCLIGSMGPMTFLIFVVSFSFFVNCINAEHHEEMMKMEEDLGDFIGELRREGFHPYQARFTNGLREKISSVRESKECKSGMCKIQMEIISELKVKEGREYGFDVYNKNQKSNLKESKHINLNVKLNNLKTECTYKLLYKTGPTKHKQFSGDTCTTGCATCQKLLDKEIEKNKNVKGEVYRVNHENTASWSCDGPGCLAINNGCTCGACFCEIEHDDIEVLGLIKESQKFDLCIQVGGHGYCKTMDKEVKEKKIQVLNYEENMDRCPKTIVNERGKVLEGRINKDGEFENKFGSVQKIGDTIVTKREERYQESCLFLKHRFMTFSQCCKDTFHMKSYLHHSDLIPMGKESRVFYKNEKEIGTWKVNLLVPTLTYLEKEDNLKLESLKIEDCMGCHDCEEGGSCLLVYKSNYDVTLKIECDGCQTDSDLINIKRGIKSTPFNIFCKGEEVKLTCKVGDKSYTALFRLKRQPKKPHGDSYINMDREKFIHEECEGIFCGLKFPDLNLFGWIKWVIYIIIFVVVIFAIVYLLFKVFKMFHMLKKD